MVSILLLLHVVSVYFTDNVCGLNVVSVGDWGDDSTSGMQRQERLAQVMSNVCGLKGCDFFVSSGDNFYDTGIHSIDDPRFNTSWRWVYDKPNIANLPWYQTLGNHDYGIIDDRELYQVNYTALEPRWKLPWLWYDFVITEGDFSVHFIMVDSMSILIKKYDWESELAWYNATLAQSTADWKVVVKHYPPYTFGNYATGSIIHRQALVPAAEQYGLDFFIAGHDHNVQHISKFEPDIDYIVSAGGGRGLYEFDARRNATLVDMGFESKYFGYHWGFVLLQFSKQEALVEFNDIDGNMVYSFTRSKPTKK